MISVMAVAMTFVLSAGEIDLSVGAVAGLASVDDRHGHRPARADRWSASSPAC